MGHWIRDIKCGTVRYKCNECGCFKTLAYHFCPDCGDDKRESLIKTKTNKENEMLGAIPVFKDWKRICKSHSEEFEPGKIMIKCENCQLKDLCINRKKPFVLSDEDITKLVRRIEAAVKE